jgi:hypothetical protein
MNSSSGHLMKVSASFLLVLMVFGSFLHNALCVEADDEASFRVGEAEKAVQQAFVAVLDAEGAGANVSGLVIELNEAGTFLTEAEIAYSGGNFSEALRHADRCSVLVDDVMNEALSLKSSALADGQRVFWWTFAFSLMGAFGFFTASCIVWVWFEHVYVRKWLTKKPKVVS